MTTIYPYTAWKVPYIHNAFENAAATISGVEGLHIEILNIPIRIGDAGGVQIRNLSEVVAEQTERLSTGMAELDRVLGGGLVTGSVVLT